MALRRNTHHVFRLMYPFVWTPTYRHKVFSEPYRATLKGIIRKVPYHNDIELIEREGAEAHIPMVVRTEPKTASSDVMQIVKRVSAGGSAVP